MRGVDLHPEDLIEREARGDLTDDERARLQAHLDVCAVCRFEVRAREDVRDEVDAAEEVDVQRLLSAVLTPEMARAPAPRPILRRRTRAPRALLLAAALVTVASAAGAAGWTTLRSTLSHRGQVVETRVEAPTPVLTGTPVPAHATPVVPVAPTPELPSASTPAPAPELTLAPAPVVAPTHAVAPAPLALAAPPAPLPDLTAGNLFERANEARHAGDRTGAIQTYRTLVAQFPASAEAHQALAALGKMLLDGGDAGAALRCFDDYLRGGGPLRQDVMADRALALQRLGRPADETAAWSALLAYYPASVHAERARRRLAELEKP